MEDLEATRKRYRNRLPANFGSSDFPIHAGDLSAARRFCIFKILQHSAKEQASPFLNVAALALKIR